MATCTGIQPTKPGSDWDFFVRDRRKQEGCGLTLLKLREEWEALESAARQPWIRQAEEAYSDYKLQLADWRQTNRRQRAKVQQTLTCMLRSSAPSDTGVIEVQDPPSELPRRRTRSVSATPVCEEDSTSNGVPNCRGFKRLRKLKLLTTPAGWDSVLRVSSPELSPQKQPPKQPQHPNTTTVALKSQKNRQKEQLQRRQWRREREQEPEQDQEQHQEQKEQQHHQPHQDEKQSSEHDECRQKEQSQENKRKQPLSPKKRADQRRVALARATQGQPAVADMLRRTAACIPAGECVELSDVSSDETALSDAADETLAAGLARHFKALGAKNDLQKPADAQKLDETSSSIQGSLKGDSKRKQNTKKTILNSLDPSTRLPKYVYWERKRNRIKVRKGDTDNKMRYRIFGVQKYGLQQAFQMAFEFRRSQIGMTEKSLLCMMSADGESAQPVPGMGPDAPTVNDDDAAMDDDLEVISPKAENLYDASAVASSSKLPVLWSSRYAPKSFKDLPEHPWQRLSEWLRRWFRRPPAGPRRAALLVGPSGAWKSIGVGLAVQQALQGHPGGLLEQSICEVEGRRILESLLKRNAPGAAVVVLEIDGASEALRRLLARVVRITVVPMVLICSKGEVCQDEPLVNCCIQLKVDRLAVPDAALYLRKVAVAEAIHLEPDHESNDRWHHAAEAHNCDVRRALNAMQLMGLCAAEESMCSACEVASSAAACFKLLAGGRGLSSNISIEDKIKLAALHGESLALTVQENYLQILVPPSGASMMKQASDVGEEMQVLQACAHAATAIAQGDVFRTSRVHDCDFSDIDELSSCVLPCMGIFHVAKDHFVDFNVRTCNTQVDAQPATGVPNMNRIMREMGWTKAYACGRFLDWRAGLGDRLRTDHMRAHTEFQMHVLGGLSRGSIAAETVQSLPGCIPEIEPVER